MEEKEKYGFIMCVCTGKCPGFQSHGYLGLYQSGPG